MKTKLVKFVGLPVVVSLFVLGCNLDPTSAGTTLSSAFFNVPTSLTGSTAPKTIDARTVTSDTWVRSSVGSFYATVRDQVRFGAEVAQSMKSLFLDLEQVKIGDVYLLDSNTNVTHTSTDGRKFRWTTEPAGGFFLEMWAIGGGKSLELRFTRTGSHYSGTVVAAVANLGWPAPLPPVKQPDWVKAEFDTNFDGLGTARLAMSVQGFRYHADLDPGLEKGSIVLTKDASAGVVHLGSIIRGDNSRHFIWNGYVRNASNQEVLNTGVTGETRYYSAAGFASVTNKATVYLGIPTAVDATVFTGNGIGALVGRLFADRLNNNYDFDGSTDTASDQGHEIVALLNLANGDNPLLDTSTYSNNTAANVLAALQAAQGNLGSPNDDVDYLLAMMSVTNPAYFLESTYQSYGPTAPTGWSAFAESDARALLPLQATVDSMNILFESNAAPGF